MPRAHPTSTPSAPLAEADLCGVLSDTSTMSGAAACKDDKFLAARKFDKYAPYDRVSVPSSSTLSYVDRG